MGDRGRLVVPAELRQRAGLDPGTPLVLLDTERGVVVVTREQLRDLVADDLAGSDLVTELLAERRAQAAMDEQA
jgi:AbrB family looped-hinge helix DNA binding protein